ncbi:ADP-ribosylglycohydrolase family protein [Saccharopolyspora aridisoli]|uniref:ADP-ribosylglycohydrolase family protein n=2 Tax=Saccharopolyspora aridisoli TaxID=2530385 RepID=A0A4R4UH87_9PSEU|nr:ADP-ribosylglycohydrolase family protein [Saccharopolyspora aridisoli]
MSGSGDRPSQEPRAEVVELTPEEAQFIDAWRQYWRGGSVNEAESAVFDDIARKVLGEGFVRQRLVPDASGFLAQRRVVPVYDETSCGEIARNLPGGVLGGMIGDVLGSPVEFQTWNDIKRDCGGSGLTDYIYPHWGKGSISDDSQMMLFVLESLIMARVRLREADFDQRVQPRLETQIALAQWLHTQGVEWNAVLPPDMRPEPAKRYGKLIAYPELFVQRAPDVVSMSALGAFASSTASDPGEGLSSFTFPINDSQEAGGLARAAMTAIWTDVPERAFKIGATTSLITHGHPSGYLPGGVLAVLAQHLLHDQSFDVALQAAMYQLGRWPGHEDTTRALNAAIELGRSGQVSAEALDERFRRPRSAPGVLGVAVAAVLAYPEDFAAAVCAAVNHSGNSATAGAVCGVLMGLKLGRKAIPQPWRLHMELRYEAEELLRDVVAEFCAPQPPESQEWRERYLVSF